MTTTDRLLSILSLAPYVIAFFFGVLLCVIFFRRWKKREAVDDAIRNKGLHINGRIVNCHRGVLTFDLVYIYEIEEVTYSQVQHVDATTCKSVKPRDEVVVCYEPEHPQNAVLLDIGIAYIEFQITFALTVTIVIYGTIAIVIVLIGLIVDFIQK